MGMIIIRGIVAGLVVVAVTELAKKEPRYGGLLLSLPLVSILAFIFTWIKHHDLKSVSNLARETLILLPLGLPFFVPLAFAGKLGLAFWPAFTIGLVLATLAISCWLALGPEFS